MKNYVVSGKDGLAKAAGLHLLDLRSSLAFPLFSDHPVLPRRGCAALTCNTLGGGISNPGNNWRHGRITIEPTEPLCT